MAEYSFTPQFANLTGLQPISAIDVTRGGELQFQPLQAIQVPSAQPELVGQGISNALQSISQGLFGGITAKYEEKKALEKEEREHERALQIEEAKQKTKNKQFIDELKLKIASEHGLEADVNERMSAVDQAAQRLGIVNPSGEVRETKPKQTPPPSDVEAAALALDTEPLPQPDLTIPQAEVQTAVAAAEKPLAPLTTPTPVNEEITIPPPLAGMPIAQPAVETFATDQYMANQPQDPKQPRNLAGIEFKSSEKSQAFDAASKLTTPYRLVIAEFDERWGKWTLREEDKSADVVKLGIDKANLVLAQNKYEIEKAKADADRLQAEKERLKQDSIYLNSQKAKADDTLNNIYLIDDAINKIIKYPDAVGILTKSYQEGWQLPIIGDIAGWTRLAAIAGFELSKNRLQEIEDIAVALESVKANIGWDKLGEMKALSPTGASGVGALSNDERKSLQATKGSLEQSQSFEELLNTLYNIRGGVIKSTGNAISAIREVEPTYTPIASLPTLELTPAEQAKFSEVVAKIESTPEAERQSAEYKNNLKLKDDILSKYERIKKFNEKYFLQY